MVITNTALQVPSATLTAMGASLAWLVWLPTQAPPVFGLAVFLTVSCGCAATAIWRPKLPWPVRAMAAAGALFVWLMVSAAAAYCAAVVTHRLFPAVGAWDPWKLWNPGGAWLLICFETVGTAVFLAGLDIYRWLQRRGEQTE